MTEPTPACPAHFAALAVFTTGQVARACGVAPRTVAKWYDTGRLAGYRVPGSDDRRFPRARLAAFMAANGMADALAALGGASARVALGVECGVPPGPPGWEVRAGVGHAFGLYDAAADAAVRAVLVHASVGLGAARAFAAVVRAKRGACRPVLVLLAGADDLRAVEGFDAVLAEPLDPAAFWGIVEAAVPA